MEHARDTNFISANVCQKSLDHC